MAELPIPTGYGVPLVDMATKRLPQPVMDVLDDLYLHGVNEDVHLAISEALGSGGSVHTGDGPPPLLIVGAKVGDIYIDKATGNIYKLDEGA